MPMMEVPSAVSSKLCQRAEATARSQLDQKQGDELATDGNINDSPGIKAVRGMTFAEQSCPTEVTPTKIKVLERPQSSGNEVIALQYTMPAATFRMQQYRRLNILPTPSKALETKAKEHLVRPASHGKVTTALGQENEARETAFNFAPNQRPLRQLDSETVVPSIEINGVLPDPSRTESPEPPLVASTDFGGGLPNAIVTPKTKCNNHMPPPAPRAPRQTVLHGGIVKHPRSIISVRKQFPHSRPSTVDSQPSEEDLIFLLMSRNREAREREGALESIQRRLRAQLHRLNEQSGTMHQQLTAADARCARQNAQIATYQTQIDDFKTRFTKFKDYARDLTQDCTDMGKAMKHIGATTNKLIKDKADISQTLESLHKSTASASGLVIGLKPKIAAAAHQIGPLQHALQLAEAKAQVLDASLQHERLRSNRIESKILNSQQVQERLSLSSTKEYRKAAGYLDDLCQAIIQLSARVTKKQQSKDTPGVVECLSLLQTLAEKQGEGMTMLTGTKALIGTVSERILSYHTAAEEANRTATSVSNKLSKDVVSQIATFLGGLGPSFGTEVNFATLRERAASMQKQIAFGHQMINLAYDGKNASEQREKEQSIRVDKVLEQLAAANGRQEPTPKLDVSMILTKSMQAHSQVVQKDGELQRLREQADGAIQDNIHLKEQLENLEAALIQAATIPKLVGDLAAKDAELAQLRSQAREKCAAMSQLEETVSSTEAQLSELRSKDRDYAAKDAQNILYQWEITALQINWDDFDQLKKDLAAQKDIYAKQVARVSDLQIQLENSQSQLENSQTCAGHVSDLQVQVGELSQRCGNLQQQLSDATKAAEGYQVLQNSMEQKDDEIGSLKTKVKTLGETSLLLVAAQEENQQKSRQLDALRESITKRDAPQQSLRPGHAHGDETEIGDGQEKEQNRPARPPSSSYGADSMLLEAFEAAEMLNESRVGALSQDAGMSLPGGTPGSRPIRSSESSQTNDGLLPGRRLRSGLSLQGIEETQTQEQRPSTPIMSSSPGGPRNLANSGLKRPRMDPIEAPATSQPTSKRLQRTTANLEVKPPSSTSARSQIAEPGVRPSGIRKGSVIGANAPAPGKARGGRKTTRKGNKSDRYAERFSNE